MDYKKIRNLFFTLFWLFLIGSMVGFVLESIVVILDTGILESRQGLLYGPFTPVYGVGSIVYYLTLPKCKNKSSIFFVAAIWGAVVEYACSYVQEKVFGTVSWDYVGAFLSIHGRTAFKYWIYWGIIGIFFMKVVYPRILRLQKYEGKKPFQFATVILAILIIGNITISSMAAYRQKERIMNVATQSKIGQFLDTYYPDYVINRVYANKIHKYEVK